GGTSGSPYVTEFRLENHLPVWRYEVEDVVIEKYVLFLYGQNTVHIHYHVAHGPDKLRLELRPSVHFRRHEASVGGLPHDHYTVALRGHHVEFGGGESLPPLRLVLKGEAASFTHDGGSRREIFYQKEADRGY